MKHILITLFLAALTFREVIAYTNPLKIEEIRYDTKIRFPYIVSEHTATDSTAHKINQRLKELRLQ